MMGLIKVERITTKTPYQVIPFKVSQVVHLTKALKISGKLNRVERSTKKLHLLFQRKNRAIQTLERTVSSENNHYVGLLWKNDQPSLINNQNLGCTRLYSLERKLKGDPSLAAKYMQPINQYINKGHAKKLTEKESKNLTSITNYILHHRVTNVNKPRKVSFIYDALVEFNNMSLNKNLLKSPDLLNNLLGLNI